jgi:hypothetical protein
VRKLSTVAALLLGVLVVQAQPPDAKGTGRGGFKGGGGYAPQNLQVLDKNTFPNSMQAFVQALGVCG